MIAASPALITILNSQQFYKADLYTITLNSGTILRYTDADGDLIVGANTFICTGPIITRGTTRIVPGIEVDTLDISIRPKDTDLISGITFQQFTQNGGFDGAYIQVDRIFMSTFGDTTPGVINRFYGRVSDSQPSRSEIVLTVKSLLELLNTMMPRNLYQFNCVHTLFDAGCTLSKASFASNSSATSGSTASTINCGLAQAVDFFKLGTIIWLTGANAGVTRTIKDYSPGVLKLSLALQFVPTIGDTFTVYPGCDKQQTTCGGVEIIFTALATTDFLTVPNADYASGVPVTVRNTGGALPAPLAAATTYYTLRTDKNKIKLAATLGGAAINLTTNGTGTQFIKPTSKFNNIGNFRGFRYIPIPEIAL